MRDGINLAQRGVPAVVFVHEQFEKVARAQTRISGVPNLRICVYPQYQLGHIAAEVEHQKAAKAVEGLQELIVGHGEPTLHVKI